jgi:hypothetical protein
LKDLGVNLSDVNLCWILVAPTTFFTCIANQKQLSYHNTKKAITGKDERLACVTNLNGGKIKIKIKNIVELNITSSDNRQRNKKDSGGV